MRIPSERIADDVAEVLFTEEAIQLRVIEIARQISRDYAGKNPLLVGVLSGVVLFMGDLLRHITIPMTLDFMAVNEYAATPSSGTVRITKDLDQSITDRHVIFVEDVIDTGLTLSYLLRALRTRNPASLQVCVLFDRPHRRLIDIPLAYQGFRLPDRFVVGYGLDAGGHYRNLPFVGVLKDGGRVG
jgi:hypoxanthine phosphoribosyltransferase